MEKQQPKNITGPEKEKAVDEPLLMRVRSAESRLLQNIKWISLAIAALYLLGYIWRVFYYGRLGIPAYFLDLPFPEILIPKGVGVMVFLAWLIIPFSYKKFNQWILETDQLRFVKASSLFNKILWVLCFVALAALLYTKQHSLIAFAALGYSLGKVAFKLSSLSYRVQFWHLLWICFLVVCAVQLIDAWISAARDMKLGKFPLVRLSSNNQDEDEKPKVLLGFFKGKYFIASPDELYGHKLTVLDSSHVENMDIAYLSWLEESMRKGKKELDEVKKTLEELRGKQEQLAKEIADPNAPDDTKLTKLVSPHQNE